MDSESTLIIIILSIALFLLGIKVGEASIKDQTIRKICSFTQPPLNDYTYCYQKSYDEVMFTL